MRWTVVGACTLLILGIPAAGPAAAQEEDRPETAFELPAWEVGTWWVCDVFRRDRSEERTGIPRVADPPPTVPGYPPLQGPGARDERAAGRFRFEVVESGVPVTRTVTYLSDPEFSEEDEERPPDEPLDEAPGGPEEITETDEFACWRVRMALVPAEEGEPEPLADLFFDEEGLRLRKIELLGSQEMTEVLPGDAALRPRAEMALAFPLSWPDLPAIRGRTHQEVVRVRHRPDIRQTALGRGDAPTRWLIVVREARGNRAGGVEMEWPEDHPWWSRCRSGDLRGVLVEHGGP